MEFVLRWSDDVRAGNVQMNGKSGTYEVRIPVSVEQVSGRDLGCPGGAQMPPVTQSAITLPSSPTSSTASVAPFREHRPTPIIGTGVLSQGTYSDRMASFSEKDIANHLNIQRIRLEENPDRCGIAFLSVDKIWFGSSVKTTLTINGVSVGALNGPTGRHGCIFNVPISVGDRICVKYFESSGFQIIFGLDLYYYDSYCYRGNY